MPFSLVNCGTVLSRFMNKIFSDILDKYVVVYLDDILVYSKDLSLPDMHVRKVLQRIQDNRLFAKLEVCLTYLS